MSTRPVDLTPEQRRNADAVLRGASVAYLAMVEDAPGASSGSEPYVVPINFAYEGGLDLAPNDAPGGRLPRLLFHAGAGRKTRALAKNPRVCLAVALDVTFVAGTSPCEDGFAFRSVLIWGEAFPLENPQEREEALRTIVTKYDPGATDRTFDRRALRRTIVFAVTIDALGYKERLRPD
jgi:nitroimidazol reductase NimA-like FMN-containing flavoprotein (pyridoxamine 5'-phosphate oxidase superfamily)